MLPVPPSRCPSFTCSHSAASLRIPPSTPTFPTTVQPRPSPTSRPASAAPSDHGVEARRCHRPRQRRTGRGATAQPASAMRQRDDIGTVDRRAQWHSTAPSPVVLVSRPWHDGPSQIVLRSARHVWPCLHTAIRVQSPKQHVQL